MGKRSRSCHLVLSRMKARVAEVMCRMKLMTKQQSYSNRSMTHRRAIKEKSKVANRDWVDHQACSLLKYINVIANLFIMRNYFNDTALKNY